METPEQQRRSIVLGVASLAVTLADTGQAEGDAREGILNFTTRLTDSAKDLVKVLRDATAEISSLPQPIDKSAERLERGRPARQMFGVPEPTDELANYLKAREWLENLANEMERRRGSGEQ